MKLAAVFTSLCKRQYPMTDEEDGGGVCGCAVAAASIDVSGSGGVRRFAHDGLEDEKCASSSMLL